MSQEQMVLVAQNLLIALGYDLGAIDGQVGPTTVAAIRSFQKDQSLPSDGRLSASLLVELSASVRRKAKR